MILIFCNATYNGKYSINRLKLCYNCKNFVFCKKIESNQDESKTKSNFTTLMLNNIFC